MALVLWLGAVYFLQANDKLLAITVAIDCCTTLLHHHITPLQPVYYPLNVEVGTRVKR